MPKKLPDDLTARIESEIARHPEGIGIDDLHAILANIVSRYRLRLSEYRAWQPIQQR